MILLKFLVRQDWYADKDKTDKKIKVNALVLVINILNVFVCRNFAICVICRVQIVRLL